MKIMYFPPWCKAPCMGEIGEKCLKIVEAFRYNTKHLRQLRGCRMCIRYRERRFIELHDNFRTHRIEMVSARQRRISSHLSAQRLMKREECLRHVFCVQARQLS